MKKTSCACGVSVAAQDRYGLCRILPALGRTALMSIESGEYKGNLAIDRSLDLRRRQYYLGNAIGAPIAMYPKGGGSLLRRLRPWGRKKKGAI
jgi:hypothetical protein